MSWISSRSVDGGLDRVDLSDALGAIWLCGKHLAGPDPEGTLVRANHAAAIACFCQPHELDERYPGYVEWLEANAATRAHWFAIPDLTSPTLDDATVIASTLAARLQDGDDLVLHCAAGKGRAPTMAICTMVMLGIAATDALERVASARPGAGPEVGSQAELVAAFEQRRIGAEH